MALTDYTRTATGGTRAPARSKEALLADLKKAHKSPQELGLSKSTREGITDEATVKATQIAKEGAQELAQAGLAGGGHTGQKAEGARQAIKTGAVAGGAASAGASQLSQNIAKTAVKEGRARLEAQHERANRSKEFWLKQGTNMAKGLSGAMDFTKGKG